MAIVDGSLQLGYKNTAWFTANASLVLLVGQIVYLEQTGNYKLGDGVTQLSALTFLGLSAETQTLQAVTDLGSNTTNQMQINGVNVATVNDIPSLSGYEQTVNKSTNVNSDQASNVKYPSVKAVYDWVTSIFVKKGTLTTNTIQKATSSDTIGDSSITDDGTKVIIDADVKITEHAVDASLVHSASFNNRGLFDATGQQSILWNSRILKDSSSNDSYDWEGRKVYRMDLTTSINYNASKLYDASSIEILDWSSGLKCNQLTASQIVETDASKNLVSASKQSGYNLPLGTTAGTVLEGNRITQTITNGVTDKAPSEDAVHDALALKLTQNNFTDITSSCTVVGWASYTTKSIRAVDMGDYYIVTGYIVGISNSTITTVKMPYTNNGHRQGYSGYGVNNGTSIFTRIILNGASDTIDFKTGAEGNAWNATGTKEIIFNLIIEK